MRNSVRTATFSVIMSAAMLVGITSPALAQSSSSAGSIRDTLLSNVCTRVGDRIDNLSSRYDDNKQKHIDAYNHIKTNLQTLDQKLITKGYDTTQLEADLQTLNADVLQFANQYTQFINTLKDAKTIACGNSNGEYKAKVEEARTYLQQARDTAIATRQFIVDHIKPDLQALRDQKSSSSTSSSAANQS